MAPRSFEVYQAGSRRRSEPSLCAAPRRLCSVAGHRLSAKRMRRT